MAVERPRTLRAHAASVGALLRRFVALYKPINSSVA
jgi:hypothetical protein